LGLLVFWEQNNWILEYLGLAVAVVNSEVHRTHQVIEGVLSHSIINISEYEMYR
jgi:hypothetical protein